MASAALAIALSLSEGTFRAAMNGGMTGIANSVVDLTRLAIYGDDIHLVTLNGFAGPISDEDLTALSTGVLTQG